MVDGCSIIEESSSIPGFELRISSGGFPYYVGKRKMPRIRDEILDCAIYLYPSVADAKAGERAGGSGFLVGVYSEVYTDKGLLYGVTNSHVIREGQSPVIRLNTTDGDMDALDIEPSEWYHHPDGDDIAVCPLVLSLELYKFKCITPKLFLTDALISEHNIGIGDEVFVVGRFVTHEGKQRNIPSLRFGNIAMMPHEPIRNERGILQESFLVELRSISGYSGSPVFVHILPFSKRPSVEGWSVEKGPWLLGVDWGHIHDYEPVRDKAGEKLSEEWNVRTNSGMAGVIPTWKLQELLDIEELVMQRKELDKSLTKEKDRTGTSFDAAIHQKVRRKVKK